MGKKKTLLVLVLILLIISSGSSVYGQKGLSWLQETFLPQVKTQPLIVTGKVEAGQIVLNWETEAKDVTAFAVVIAKNNTAPRYPEDGCLCLLDAARRSYTIDPLLVHQGGDVEGLLQRGETYYFSITAITADKTIAGNALALKIPDDDKISVKPDVPQEADKEPDEKPQETTVKKPKNTEPQPEKPKTEDPQSKNPDPQPPAAMLCRAWVKNDVIKMDWSKGEEKDFQGYKVVISDTNSAPSYPQDGYLYYITSIGQNYAVIDNQKPYSGGSIGGYLQPGKTYYFAVTYIYKDRKATTPAVQLTTPQTMAYPEPIMYVSPVITSIQDEADAVDYNILIHFSWDGDPSKGFKGFKAELTDLETGKATHHYLGNTPGVFTLYCDGSSKEPTIEPYRYYKVRIIAVYDGKLIYSEYSRPVRSYGDTC